MLCAIAVGVLMSLVGAFALGDNPIGIRTVYLVGINLAGAAIDMLAYRLACQFAWSRGRYWHRALLATVLVVVPVGALIWGSTWLVGRNLPVAALLVVFVNTFVISGAFIAAFVAPPMDAVLRSAEASTEAATIPQSTATGSAASPTLQGSHFMERLPGHLRTAELWAVKAEDH